MKFNDGKDSAAAAALAKGSDVAIVFAYQWESEGMDLDTLSLPDGQDALIQQIAAANPRTIVVLETGTAVTMPGSIKSRAFSKRGMAAAKALMPSRTFCSVT